MFPIKHKNLILRPFETLDAEAFAVAARESVATVGVWMPWCVADYSATLALDWFAVCDAAQAANTGCDLGVFAEDGELLGGVGLNQFNRLHNFANLGYWVRATRQRQGVCLRAAQALAHHGFSELGFGRIEIIIAEGNEPSNAVARKLGAVFEGHARNRLVIRGVPVAASVYSLIASDFSF
jgi:ribosomal-protein-serine acetyltransferase